MSQSIEERLRAAGIGEEEVIQFGRDRLLQTLKDLVGNVSDVQNEASWALSEGAQTEPSKAPIVMIATPAYGGEQILHSVSVLEAIAHLRSKGRFRVTRQFSSGNPILPYARANLFGKFVHSEADWLFMIDNDIGFPPELIERMIDFGEPMVAAVAPKRALNIRAMLHSGKAVDGIQWPVWPGPIELRERPLRHGFVEVDAVGTAFFGMNRDAALAMVRRWGDEREGLEMIDDEGIQTWSLFHIAVHQKRPVMEDMAFFGRWKSMGGKIWAILDAPLTHTGTVTIGASLGAAVRGEDIPIQCAASDALFR